MRFHFDPALLARPRTLENEPRIATAAAAAAKIFAHRFLPDVAPHDEELHARFLALAPTATRR